VASDDAYENEWKGANTGLNPMFGDWQHRFKFAPVPYGDGGAKLADFRKAIRGALTNNFFYTSEVRLEIIIPSLSSMVSKALMVFFSTIRRSRHS
jgi:hypothetical protein